MILPDVNVLITAFRDDMPRHEITASWFEEQINGPSVFGMSERVVEGFIRIVTHPNALSDPTPTQAAIEFSEALLGRSNCKRINPGERHWNLFLDLASETGAKGNAVSDAWLAALAIESGSEWITWDKGFARYPGLKWATPSLSA